MYDRTTESVGVDLYWNSVGVPTSMHLTRARKYLHTVCQGYQSVDVPNATVVYV